MKLYVSLSSFILLQCLYFVFVNGDCPATWNPLGDNSGVEYGYQVVLQSNITYFQARQICLKLGSDIASIHSQSENEFVYSIVPSGGLNLFIGMHQKLTDNAESSVLNCSWSDATACDFGNFNGEDDPARQQYPWIKNPTSTTDGNPVECVEITDTMQGVGSPDYKWNDIACYDRLDGVVCKKNCSDGTSGDNGESTTLQPSSTTVATNAPEIGGDSGSATLKPPTTGRNGVPGVSGAPGVPGNPGSGSGGSATLKPPTTGRNGVPGVSGAPGVPGNPGSGSGGGQPTLKPQTTRITNVTPLVPGSSGNCPSQPNTGYKCGSDDWHWKTGRDGKSFAYKHFDSSNCTYFDATSICAKYHARPCSVHSEEENEFLMEEVVSLQFSSGRVKRDVHSANSNEPCIWLGHHITYKENKTSCYCDDGNECTFGNNNSNKENNGKDDNNGKDKKEKKNKKDKDDKGKEKKNKKSEEECSCAKKNKTKKPKGQKTTTPMPLTTKPQPSNPWAPGCPSKPGSGSNGGCDNKKHCVAMGKDGKWRDISCEQPGTGIICKRPCTP